MVTAKNENTKKIIFVTTIFAITVLLTIIFSSQNYKFNVIVSKKNILEYYIKSLQPLYFKEKIDKKGIFEFATTGKLHFGNDNEHLVVRSFSPSLNIFKNNTLPQQDVLNSYDKFVKFFNLSKAEQSKLDSILLSYRTPLVSSILVGNGTSYAVNSDLDKIKTALEFDIKNFESQIIAKRSPKFSKELLAISRDKNLKNLREKLLKNIGSNFVVYSPDSIFTVKSKVKIDSLMNVSGKLREKLLTQLGKNFSTGLIFDSLNQSPSSGKISFHKGKNALTITFNTDTSSVEGKLSKALNFNFSVQSDSSSMVFNINADTSNGEFNIKMKINSPDTNMVLGINFNADALSNLISQGLDGKNFSEHTKDSIMHVLDSAFKELNTEMNNDSTLRKNQSMRQFIRKFFKRKSRR